MTITLGGGVSINCIYQTLFSKIICLSFCQIPSPCQDSYMQIVCVNPDKQALSSAMRISNYCKLFISLEIDCFHSQ